MRKNKGKALYLLKQKNNGEIKITYREISNLTGYSKSHLKKLAKEVEKRDIDSILIHRNTGRKPAISATDKEIEYIRNFKNKYPSCSISQFRDIYHEDVIFNPEKQADVIEFGLQQRSKSFFQQLYKNEGWKSPIKQKSLKGYDIHPLRKPSPREGMLVMTDGTPHDWFQNGTTASLHLTLDDATGRLLSGWFLPTECLLGYCYAFKIMLEKYGIPDSIYSDRTTILWNHMSDELTSLGKMLDELGINIIYASSPQAKGKIEKMNHTLQNRLLNDIIRFNIKTYDELNVWFNKFYIPYINKKFAYKPLEKESEFVSLKGWDLSTIFCFKEDRTILNGNMISIDNHYYIPINKDGSDAIFYKGTHVEVWKDVFTSKIRIVKNGKIYNTRLVPGHIYDKEKKKQKQIESQKELEIVLKERDERLKARRNKVSSL